MNEVLLLVLQPFYDHDLWSIMLKAYWILYSWTFLRKGSNYFSYKRYNRWKTPVN